MDLVLPSQLEEKGPGDNAAVPGFEDEKPFTTRHASEDAIDGPDGGLRGWSIVFADWIIQFVMAGAITGFGAFQTYYSTTYLPKYSTSTISWIGTVEVFLELALGFIGGRLLDGGRFHSTVAIGCLVFVFSLFMLSLAKPNQYYQVFLAQGVGLGVGLGIAFLPTSGVVAHHFTKNRALAMGITTTGVSLGGFAWAAMFNHFFNGSIGFHWGVRIAGFISLFALILSNILFRFHPGPPRHTASSASSGSPPSEKPKPPTVLFILRDPAYLITFIFAFIYCLGLYFPMFYVQIFAESHHIDQGLANWALSIINLCGIPGRIVPNWIADQMGIFPVYIFCMTAAAVLCLVMPVCTTIGPFLFFCIAYGFFSGSLVSLFFPTFIELNPNPAEIGVRLGLACMACAVANLIGTPIAGALVGPHNKWVRGTSFAGVAQLIAAVLLCFAYRIHSRRNKPGSP
ncbi:MFS general substrate transporter [Rickenella mellea]|uniref:MFS general substrate transporter n=1 Tax=Rickenella mellea TaxID=50990 RepID=A0A4Y7PNE3_9AGAM|nr:MFS general substrate transporter [Rickenella mellea]